MSDAVQNEIVGLGNEYNRLQRQLESKTQRLQALLEENAEAGSFPTDFVGARNRRYAIDFQFKPSTNNDPLSAEWETALQPQERAVTVESGTIFRCAYVESFLRAVGTANDPYTGLPVTVQATLPWGDRLELFDYFWRVRDTGTDREWCDRPQPSMFFGGGYVGPLWFPRRNMLGGGNTIYATIEPIVNRNGGGASGFFADGQIEQYTLQLSFVGHEVPDVSAP